VNDEFPLIGRDVEFVQMKNALRDQRPLLVFGPPGIGKSRLIEGVCSTSAAPPVRIRCPAHPHELLVDLARALLNSQHRSLTASLRCSSEAISHETSVHLRGVLWKSLSLEPRSLILEDISGASAPMYRFLQPLYHTAGMSIIATSVSSDRLGFLHRLFWDPRERLEIKPLHDHDARRLASLAAERFRLPVEIDRTDLEERVLNAAGGNPGRIIEMYRLAADSRYHSGDYVKMALIQIDLAARFTG
jgi:hypothetical protein